MARVIVIGGANVDIKGRSHGPLISGTSNPGEVVVSPGGVGRNIAENLARLGVDTALLAFVGDDTNGRFIREATAAAGVDVSMLAVCGKPTGVYLAVLDDAGEMHVAVNDMRSADALDVTHLEAQHARLAAADMVVADCNIPIDCLEWLCRFAEVRGTRLLIEPISVPKSRKLLNFTRPSPVFAITPNQQQLRALTKESDQYSAIARLHDLGFANIVVHCGEEGVIVSDGRSPLSHLKTQRVDGIADVTGAGDAAVAGLVCGLVSGLVLARSAMLGQAAAAIKLGSRNSVADEINRDRVFALAGISQDC